MVRGLFVRRLARRGRRGDGCLLRSLRGVANGAVIPIDEEPRTSGQQSGGCYRENKRSQQTAHDPTNLMNGSSRRELLSERISSRQLYLDDSTGARIRLDFHHPVMQVDGAQRKRQPKPAASFLGRVIQVEDVAEMFRGDALSVILD